MLQKGMTIREAAERWANGFNAFPFSMIELLHRTDPESWHEITLPRRCDRVSVYNLPKDYLEKCASAGKKPEREGEVTNYVHSADAYMIKLDDGEFIGIGAADFEIQYDGKIPNWAVMWSFGNGLDNDWLAEGGLAQMCCCGFRVFEHDEWGYFFGLDGGGYDFFEEHWVPLYLARGIQWHDPTSEKAAG